MQVEYRLFVGPGETADFESPTEGHPDDSFVEFARQAFDMGLMGKPIGDGYTQVKAVVYADGHENLIGPRWFNEATNYVLLAGLSAKHKATKEELRDA